MTASAATRNFRRAVTTLAAGVLCWAGCVLSKSSVSRRFKVLTQAKFDEWTASDPSETSLVTIPIDWLHVSDRLLMIGAVGIDASGRKRPLVLIEGATENTAAVQALLDDLIERGLDPESRYLFIVDGAEAMSKAVRRTFSADIAVQRCQVHKVRNITDRLAVKRHAAVRRKLRPAWELDDADKAERLMRDLVQRFEQKAPDVSRPGLPFELRRSLASTNIIESMNSTVRRVCRNVKRWKNAGMALRQPRGPA